MHSLSHAFELCDADTTDRAGELPLPFSDDDARWAALAFNPGDDDDLELAACQSAFLDAHELGLISPGLAEAIARSSFVGMADAILHEGSDPRFCGCYGCVERRTRHYGDAE
jgi:hypothetical protein